MTEPSKIINETPTGENHEEKGLTPGKDYLNIFGRQIQNKAFEVQYGEMTVKFKVRGGVIREAHILDVSEKLRPF